MDDNKKNNNFYNNDQENNDNENYYNQRNDNSYNKFYETNSYNSDNDYLENNPLRPSYRYNNQGSYVDKKIVATLQPYNTETPANNSENIYSVKKPKKERKKSGRFFSRMVTYALVAVIAGSAGGSATYAYIKNNDAAGNSIVKEADNENSSINTNTKTSSNSSGAITDVVDIASDSVVEITTSSEQQNPFVGSYVEDGAGSGVILSEDGYIVTNNHVIAGANTIKVVTTDGKEYDAEVIGSDKETDLAVLKIDAKGLKPVTMANSDEIKVGEVAVAIGNPLGSLGGTVTDGIVSAKDRKIQLQDGTVMSLLQTSAAVNRGNSGGGLFNEKGQLIGIVNAKSSGDEVEGLGFAIPSNLVKEVVDDIVEKGYVSGRPRLGIQVVEITTPEEALKYRVDSEGIYVAKNEGDSDLMVGDRIIAVGKKEVLTNSDIKEALKEFKAGDTIDIVVLRDKTEITVSVLLTESLPDGR